MFVACLLNTLYQGVKLIFFSDGHLAPGFSKVVANSKMLVPTFKDKQNLSVSVLDSPSKLKLGKISLTRQWTVAWMIYKAQAHLNP